MAPLWIALAALADARGATLVACGALPDDGSCYLSLREAVEAASAGDVIELETGLYHEQILVEKDLTLRGRPGHLLIGPFDPSVNSMIQVRGATLTLDGIDATTASVRVVEATDGATLVLRDVQLAGYGTVDHGGVILASSSVIRFEGESIIGPGRAVRGGLLLLSDSDLDTSGASRVTFQEGVALEDGGAIAVGEMKDAPGKLVLDGSEFRDNRAGTDGGAISAIGVDVLVGGLTWFERNAAARYGGAIYGSDTRIEIVYGHFEGNEALAGGAIGSLDETGQPISVVDSSFIGNRAGFGGAIGGGMASLDVTRSYFSANEAPSGGGIWWSQATRVTVVRSRFCDNASEALSLEADTVTVRNSELYRNRSINALYSREESGGVLQASAWDSVTIDNNHFIANEGLGTSALSVGGAGPLVVTDNLVAWNDATPRTSAESAWAIWIDDPYPEAVEAHHNLFFENAADGTASTGPEAGIEADPRLPYWDVDSACEEYLGDWNLPGWPSWYSPMRDGGSGEPDLDGTVADIGAYGGPRADDFGFTDVDGDGYDHLYDCWDDAYFADALAYHPEAPDLPYDGLDHNCDWRSDDDADHDGHDAAEHGGDDCNDVDSTWHPGAVDVPYDGFDQDCDGVLDDDRDDDGWSYPADCDDTDPTIYPGAPDEDPARDRDCDGRTDLAQPLQPRTCAVGGGSGPWALLALLALTRRRGTPSGTSRPCRSPCRCSRC